MLLDWLLLASVALYAVQASYSADVAKAVESLAFFYVPFGLLYVLLREGRGPRGSRCGASARPSRSRSCSRGSASSSTTAKPCC